MLTLHNISKRFLKKQVLNNISYSFPNNTIIAIIGANGAGKTTLLNILSRLEEPDSGTVNKPRDLVIGYLPQEPNFTPEPTVLNECVIAAGALYELKVKVDELLHEMEHNYSLEVNERYEEAEKNFRVQGGYALEATAKMILSGLGFEEAQFNVDPKSLSGGWRMRLELAKILLKKPDFLILDEPTNHLDLPSIAWLEQYLKKFRGTLVFVSHDEDLLNRLAKIILHLHEGNLNEYHGNFDDFLVQYEENQARRIAQVNLIQKKIANVERFVDRFKATASKAAQAQSRIKMLANLRAEANEIAVDRDPAEISLKLNVKQKSGENVLRLERCAIGYEKPLAKNISLYASRGNKISVIGANGIGKSTLLKSLVKQIPFIEGKVELGHNVSIGYYSQDQLNFLDLKENCVDNLIKVSPGITIPRARALLGSLLLKGDEAFKKVGVLSGGERSRLGLACLLAQDANLLLLDEPTNHLDMASCEVLAEALADYEGTVIFVSHNRKFINQFATHVFAMTKEGKSQLFEGQLDDYERLAEKCGFTNILQVK